MTCGGRWRVVKRWLADHVAVRRGELMLTLDVGVQSRVACMVGHWRVTFFVNSGGWVGLPSGVSRVRALQLRPAWPPVSVMDELVNFYARGG